mmetsp:Transcript_9165/g.17492  ORF Transcript_9165/g.17492 Transcript_9165/m.17492 type:complete len:113 (-) Transcript_9165:47-385(-)
MQARSGGKSCTCCYLSNPFHVHDLMMQRNKHPGGAREAGETVTNVTNTLETRHNLASCAVPCMHRKEENQPQPGKRQKQETKRKEQLRTLRHTCTPSRYISVRTLPWQPNTG